MSLSCRLCHASHDGTVMFFEDKFRPYYQCTVCQLVFVPPSHVLSAEAEKQEYELHENNVHDVGYRTFLSRAAAPLLALDPITLLPMATTTTEPHEQETRAVTSPDAMKATIQTGRSKDDRSSDASFVVQGLDFGCGPAPALATMLKELRPQWSIALYDKYFFPDDSVLLSKSDESSPSGSTSSSPCSSTLRSHSSCTVVVEGPKYHFITATEVVEHLADPGTDLRRLWSLLRPGGLLVLMTKRVLTVDAFRHWHYKNDRTHISFFHEETFRFLAKHWLEGGAELDIVGKDVVTLRKPTHRHGTTPPTLTHQPVSTDVIPI